jgi:lipopolysaccharide transport system ATP-binding protein
MSAPPAIRVQGLWKEYVVNHARERHGTFYDLLASGLKAPFHRLRQLGGEGHESGRFWALQDVSFDVAPGEVVGIIGRNGAGKSTLLKILSRITAPSKGRIEVRGRLASLLEVGTGFHPELSGRENIYLNGAILGMSRAEVARKFDEIVAFAEVEKFIDTPVKRYSSGMYVRLAFAVAAHLDVDVLVVDEVLAVGDTAFQEKCMAKMENVSGHGRTVLFVSHNLSAVSRLCTKALLLDAGQVKFNGDVHDAFSTYARLSREAGDAQSRRACTGPFTDTARIAGFWINDADEPLQTVIRPNEPIQLRLVGALNRPVPKFRTTLCIYKGGQLVLGLHDAVEPSDMPAGAFESTFTIPPFFLSPGDYSIDINMYSDQRGEWLAAHSYCLFSVANQWFPWYEPTHGMGLVNLDQSGHRRVLV